MLRNFYPPPRALRSLPLLSRRGDPYPKGFLLALSFLFFAVSANAQGMQSFEVENLRVTLDTWAVQGAIGYFPVELDIENLGADRTIEISSETQLAGGYYRGSYSNGGIQNLRQILRLKPRDHLHLTIPIPAASGNQNSQLRILEHGRVLRLYSVAYQSTAAPTSLIVADPSSAFGTMAKDLPVAKPEAAPGFPPGSPAADRLREPERLPVNWLGYTTLHSVFIGTQEWGKLSDVQKDALLAWTAAGGNLFLADGDGKTLFPDAAKQPAAWGAGGAAERYFLGQIYFTTTAELSNTQIEPMTQRASNGPNSLAAVAPQDRAIADPAIADLRTEAAALLKTSTGLQVPWQLPGRLFGSNPDEAAMRGYRTEIVGLTQGFRLPIPGVSGIPARAYLGILVLFTLLIGPANYFILKRKRQQVLMVLTTPLISAAFIAVLAGYAIAGDGFGLRTRAETLTFLDQGAKQAVTRSVVSMYAAGMAPWGGMRFARDTAIFPISNNPRSSDIDLTELQQYASGLAPARTPVNFDQVVVRVARERLSFSRDGGHLSAFNGLGAAITELYYRDGGRVYALKGPLAAGAKGDLRASSDSDAPPLRAPAAHLIEFNHFFLNSAADGAFFAVMDRSPFWEPGAPDIDERGSLHLITGYAESAP